jgi:hypothetical protein
VYEKQEIYPLAELTTGISRSILFHKIEEFLQIKNQHDTTSGRIFPSAMHSRTVLSITVTS